MNKKKTIKKPIIIRFSSILPLAWNTIKHFTVKFRFLWTRILVALITLALATLMIFLLIRLIPGNIIDDFAIKLVDQRRIPLEDAKILAREILGYNPDESALTQLISYINNLLKGNLGRSMSNPLLSVNDVIRKNLPWTLFISTMSLTISFIVGIFLGSYTVWKKNKFINESVSGFTILSSAIPDFILGILLLYVFSYILKIFPTQDAYNLKTSIPGLNIKFIIDCLYHATLPILAYVFIQMGNWTLMMKGSCISVLGDDFIYAARARGIPDKIIVSKYLRRNALLPLITSLAISFATLFGGSPLMENIFNYPGIGQQFAGFIIQKEYFMIVGILFFTSAIIIFVNLVADSIYSLIDPRIRRNI